MLRVGYDSGGTGEGRVRYGTSRAGRRPLFERPAIGPCGGGGAPRTASCEPVVCGAAASRRPCSERGSPG